MEIPHSRFKLIVSIQLDRWCSSSEVESYDGLRSLFLVEQFKNWLPEEMAMYVTEHQVTTLSEAAVLADNYALVHKTRFFGGQPVSNERAQWSHQAPRKTTSNAPSASGDSGFRAERTQNKIDHNVTCHFCLGVGHTKWQCEALKKKKENEQKYKAKFGTATQTKGAAQGSALAISLPSQPINVNEPEFEVSFSPFISDGSVSLGADGEKVPIKILRDTGSVESFILQSVLPFSPASDTGQSVLVRGINLNVLSVPLHRVYIDSDLVQGEVAVGVRPALPLQGTAMILGNGLAKSRVWANAPPSVDKSNLGSLFEGCETPCVHPVAAVTRSASRAAAKTGDGDSSALPPLPGLPDSIPREQLIDAQRSDTSLQSLYARVKDSDTVHGYVVIEDVLMRKCAARSGLPGVYDWQLVVPSSLRKIVLETAHDDAGHMGVKKTYDRILRYCYWPRVKRDIASHVKTCHVCQLTGKPNQAIKPKADNSYT